MNETCEEPAIVIAEDERVRLLNVLNSQVRMLEKYAGKVARIPEEPKCPVEKPEPYEDSVIGKIAESNRKLAKSIDNIDAILRHFHGCFGEPREEVNATGKY